MEKEKDDLEFDLSKIYMSKKEAAIRERFGDLPEHILQMYTYEEFARLTPIAIGRLLNGYDEGGFGEDAGYSE
jgi:hypothetical protein